MCAAEACDPCDRFPEVNSQELKELIEQKDSKNTQKSTAGQVNIFRDYLLARNMDTNFEEWGKQELADCLKKFYVEVRRGDGKEYKTGSLINIRAGLNRHLKMQGKAVNIISEPVFAQANLSFAANQAKLKREGLGDTTHYVPIDEDDMTKLYESESGVFDIDTPEGLQNKVWFELMFFICRRGRENLRKLEKDHFAIATDANGRRYVYQCKDEMTKKIRGDSMKSRVDGGRMYETKTERCPVASFEKYLSKLNPDNNTLFQAPIRSRSSESSKPWYKNAPVGEKTLGNFMAKISLAAGLSRRYTNHSLRATCITRLDECGFAARDICNVSGHTNESSIRTYIGRPNDAKKQKISDALYSSLGDNEVPATCSRPPPSPSPQSETGYQPEAIVLSNSQIQNLMENRSVDLHDLPVSVMPQQISSTSSSSNSTTTMLSASTSKQDNRNINMNFHNCQVTINYN